MNGYFITGTDTDVGKTVTSAWLALHLDADYWKPVQSGGEGDAHIVQGLGVAPERCHPSIYTLTEPLSPHEAARRDGVRIDIDTIHMPETSRPLIVEGAGGVLVPLNETRLMADLMVRLGLPVILVARTQLGTINHTLLSLEALRGRGLEVKGVVLNGEANPANRDAIETYGRVRILGALPPLAHPGREGLLAIEPEHVL